MFLTKLLLSIAVFAPGAVLLGVLLVLGVLAALERAGTLRKLQRPKRPGCKLP